MAEHVVGTAGWLALRMSVALALLLTLSGCGGGGGSGADSGSRSQQTGLLTISVTDALGQPASNAHVEVWSEHAESQGKGETDGNGKARFNNVVAGMVWAYAYSADPSTGLTFSGTAAIAIDGSSQQKVDVELIPDGAPFTAVSASAVQASGATADGRSVDLMFRVYSFGDVRTFYLEPCEPDAADDTPVPRSNCVEDSVAFDAPYDALDYDRPFGDPVPGGTSAAFSAALLLDQGAAIALNDPANVRLYGVKHMLSKLTSEHRILLSAFGAALPDQPVTILSGGGGATFVQGGEALFPLVDSLAREQGGASPLYAAIDAMLDVTASNNPPDRRRSVVVLTGSPDSCGSTTDCQAAKQALIAKARTTGVSIVLIALGAQSESIDVRGLSELAEGGNGALLWTSHPPNLPAMFGGVIQVLDGSAGTFEGLYQVESTQDAFRSGRSVLGRFRVEFDDCPLGCYEVPVQFAARIP